jgi:hypothetical protein
LRAGQAGVMGIAMSALDLVEHEATAVSLPRGRRFVYIPQLRDPCACLIIPAMSAR